MSDSVRSRVAQIIAEQAMVDASEIKDETTMEDLGLDSLSLVEIVFGIEEAFDITVPYNANEPDESDFELSNFAVIAGAVENLIAKKDAG